MLIDHIKALNSTVTGTVVADSAIYTADNLVSFETNKIKWITRVPNQIKATKEAMQSLSIDRLTPHSKDDRYAYLELGNYYADVKQKQIIMNLKEYHRTLLRVLGKNYQINYLLL